MVQLEQLSNWVSKESRGQLRRLDHAQVPVPAEFVQTQSRSQIKNILLKSEYQWKNSGNTNTIIYSLIFLFKGWKLSSTAGPIRGWKF